MRGQWLLVLLPTSGEKGVLRLGNISVVITLSYTSMFNNALQMTAALWVLVSIMALGRFGALILPPLCFLYHHNTFFPDSS